jgi:hypothetical protein
MVADEWKEIAQAALQLLNEMRHPIVKVIENNLPEKQQELPKPICFTVVEGGDWHYWDKFNADNRPSTIHSIKFDDGNIFDTQNGWRKAREPVVACSSYHSRSLDGSCTNCGQPKEMHK